MKIVPASEYQPQINQQKQGQAPDPNIRLKTLCQEFEGVFVHSLLKGMRSTLPTGGLLEKGFGSEIVEEMRDLEVSKAVSQQQNLGIAEALYRQLSQLEEQKR